VEGRRRESALYAVEDLETVAAGGADGTNCPKNLTARSISADLKSGKLPKELAGNVLVGVVKNGEQWELYHVCTALADKNPGLCADMVATDPELPAKQLQEHPETTMRGRCALVSRILPVYRAYDAKDPAFVDLCAALAPNFDGLTSPEALRKTCQEWAAYKGNPDAFADAYALTVTPAPSRQEALDNLLKLIGDPKQCASLTQPLQREVCKERGNFQRYLATKDKAVCRSPLCRALAGEPAAVCEPYAAEVKKVACRAVYAPRYADEQTRSFQEFSDQALGLLGNKGMDSRKSLAAVNERLDKLFALRARLDAAAERIAPKNVITKPTYPK